MQLDLYAIKLVSLTAEQMNQSAKTQS